MKSLRINPGLLDDIASGLLTGARALDETPEVTVPDAGEVTGALTGTLATLYESTANVVAAFEAIADKVSSTASMVQETDQQSSGILAKTMSMFEELSWD